jgi:hypothetical protein
MPMETEQDFGGGKTGNRYCRYCCSEDGTLKSYEDVLAGMTQFIVRTEGMKEDAARKKAEAHLATMPAWRSPAQGR